MCISKRPVTLSKRLNRIKPDFSRTTRFFGISIKNQVFEARWLVGRAYRDSLMKNCKTIRILGGAAEEMEAKPKSNLKPKEHPRSLRHLRALFF